MAKKLLVTVIVLEAFQDKIDHKTQYPEGTELKVDKERADDLVARGLAKIKEEQPKSQVDEKKPAASPASGEEKKNEAEKPPVDNSETKQEDEPGTKE